MGAFVNGDVPPFVMVAQENTRRRAASMPRGLKTAVSLMPAASPGIKRAYRALYMGPSRARRGREPARSPRPAASTCALCSTASRDGERPLRMRQARIALAPAKPPATSWRRPHPRIAQRFPDAEFAGIGGTACAPPGWTLVASDASELAVMGLSEVLAHLPRLLRLRRPGQRVLDGVPMSSSASTRRTSTSAWSAG